MFLLNSRNPLVTETYHTPLAGNAVGTPYTEDTGLICRVPSRRVTRHALDYSSWAPVLVLGTNTMDRFRSAFHGLQGSAEPL